MAYHKSQKIIWEEAEVAEKKELWEKSVQSIRAYFPKFQA